MNKCPFLLWKLNSDVVVKRRRRAEQYFDLAILSIEELGAEVGGDRQGERVQQQQQEVPCFQVRNDVIIREDDIWGKLRQIIDQKLM